MNTKKLLLTLTMAVLSISAFAQFPGGGGRGMMMRGPGGGNAAMLLAREDVQEDLKLTDDQKTKLKELRDGMGEKMRNAFQEARAAGTDMADMRKVMEKMTADVMKEVNTVLSTDQQKRLKEINIQMSGNAVVNQPDIQKDLGITEAQLAKLKDLQEKQAEAGRAIFEKMRNGEIQREELQGIMEKNNKTMDAEIGKVLTEAQKTKLKEMGGKPFVKKDTEGAGGKVR